MTRTTLNEYLTTPGNTQSGLAKAVGLTQGAIHHMLKAERSIYVIEHTDGVIEIEEVKPIANSLDHDAMGLITAHFGSQRLMAEQLGVSVQVLNNWKTRGIPADRVLDVERACEGKVTRYEIRPDVFGRGPETDF